MTYSQIMTDYIGHGTHAARPATPNVAAGVAAVYYETDTGNTFVWSGSAWVQVNTSGSALTKLSETVLAAAAATITFSAIVGTYRSLQLRIDARGDAVATFANLQFRFNGDTGANYDQQAQSANGGTVSSSAVFAQTQGSCGWIAAATAPAGVSSAALIDINNYAGTTFNKEAVCQGSLKQGTSAGNLFLNTGRIFWRSSAAITSISLFPDTGNFAAGTVASLYGIS